MYLTGEADEQRLYSNALVVKYLKDLGYDIKAAGKTSRTVSKNEIESEPENETENEPISEFKTARKTKVNVKPTPEQAPIEKTEKTHTALPFVGLDALFSVIPKDKRDKLNKLTEEELTFLLKSFFYPSQSQYRQGKPINTRQVYPYNVIREVT